MLRVIGFDADDTLWENETFFRMTQERFAGLLADHVAPEELHQRLIAAERRNLGAYGFGIKGFVLSMIETAIEVTEERVPASVIRSLIEAGQEMLRHPIDLLPHSEETVAALAGDYRLVLITKGDLLDQERKLAQSGLGDHFDAVEIVSNKTEAIYRALFGRHGAREGEAMMIGNSLRSDVIPALAAGGWGVHVPHHLTWEIEHDDAPTQQPRFRVITHLGELRGLIGEIERS